MHRGFWQGNLKGMERLERRILKWEGGIKMDLKRNNIEGRKMDSSGSWIRQMEGCCVHGNEYKIRRI
jgi:hypothetical protein